MSTLNMCNMRNTCNICNSRAKKPLHIHLTHTRTTLYLYTRKRIYLIRDWLGRQHGTTGCTLSIT